MSLYVVVGDSANLSFISDESIELSESIILTTFNVICAHTYEPDACMYVRLFHGQQLQRTLMTEYGILRVQLGIDRFYLTSDIAHRRKL
jgi:hypothetical protein